jgi:hypothetical protein
VNGKHKETVILRRRRNQPSEKRAPRRPKKLKARIGR